MSDDYKEYEDEMYKEHKKLLINALRLLRSFATDGVIAKDYRHGMCTLVQDLVLAASDREASNICYHFVMDNAGGWEHCVRLPDGSPSAYCVPDDPSFGKWELVNLKLRLSLLDYSIAKAKAL